MDFKPRITQLDDAAKKQRQQKPETATPQTKVDPKQVQRAIENPTTESLTPDVVTSLQSTHGNQFVARLLQRVKADNAPSQLSFPIQAKMTVTQAGDAHEVEADNVASEVVKSINSGGADVQRDDEGENTVALKRLQREEDEMDLKRLQREDDDEMDLKRIQREDDDEMDLKRIQRQNDEEMELKRIQRNSDDPMGGQQIDSKLESTIESKRGSGSSMDTKTQSQMEGAFNADFSDVRIHTDSTSNDLNNAVQAKAFTTGQDIFMRKGEYSPGSQSGQELLAHELTHVVQQNGSKVQKKEDKNADND